MYVKRNYGDKKAYTNVLMTPVEMWNWSWNSSQNAHLRLQIVQYPELWTPTQESCQ